MTRTQALAKAVRLWGKKAAVRDNGHATSEAEREKASAEFQRIKALPENEQKALRKEKLEASSRSHYYRFTVGYIVDIAGVFSAFSVMGEGDTWNAAFAKAEKRK